MDGFDGTVEDFQDLQDAAEELDGENEVPMEEIFPSEFMRDHTDFDSFDELLEESQWDVETQEDFRAIPDEPFDEYIAETTDFQDWDEMYRTGGKQWMKKELGL
ncbi:hypothetical protein [Halobacterium salinarum]|uniref:hypothetical protein n=1 Tax=Halobacterium salinarum TaxID=2242 RepID=UPI0025561689|nr:hypothetical protein [Halobacterium salinarum]MDL0123108.1 hypothetical protein [Halobacterium salinarum]MDL0131400.1 hypothetical protein [Halobacterium salinarum]